MVINMKIRVVSLGLVVLMASCVYDPYYHGAPPHHTVSGFYPYDYYYYPNVQVYFHYSTGYYYYFLDGIWVRSRVLPPRFHLNPRDRVIVRSKSDKPYLENSQHIKKYQPQRNIKKVPATDDRNERDSHRKIYEQQQHFKKQIKQEEEYRKKKDKREKEKHYR